MLLGHPQSGMKSCGWSFCWDVHAWGWGGHGCEGTWDGAWDLAGRDMDGLCWDALIGWSGDGLVIVEWWCGIEKWAGIRTGGMDMGSMCGLGDGGEGWVELFCLNGNTFSSKITWRAIIILLVMGLRHLYPRCIELYPRKIHWVDPYCIYDCYMAIEMDNKCTQMCAILSNLGAFQMTAQKEIYCQDLA